MGAAPDKHDLTADGVPDVDRAAVAELGLALGVSTQSAQALVGDALELAYRLPTVWTRVVAGEVKPWRARTIAQGTRRLSRLGAAYVDREIAPLADRVNGPQLEGLLAAAMAAHDQELAEELAAQRAELRRVDILMNETGLAGVTPISGCVDLVDAQDLEAALSHSAAQQLAWGSGESLDVRRARALGELARQHLTFTSDAEVPAGASDAHRAGIARIPSKRQIALYVHLTDTTIRNMIEQAGQAAGVPIGRVENTETPISADVIREWMGDPHAKVSVRPVLDLAEQQHDGAYEVPARLKEQIRLLYGTCAFPGCFAKAVRCQTDHIEPYDHENPESGGQTVTENLGLLCQLHHNLKTHHGFRYVVLASGAVLWRTPHGLTIRRNRDGTLDYLSRHQKRYGPHGDDADDDADEATTSRTRRRRTRPGWDALDGFTDITDPATRSALAELDGVAGLSPPDS